MDKLSLNPLHLQQENSYWFQLTGEQAVTVKPFSLIQVVVSAFEDKKTYDYKALLDFLTQRLPDFSEKDLESFVDQFIETNILLPKNRVRSFVKETLHSNLKHLESRKEKAVVEKKPFARFSGIFPDQIGHTLAQNLLLVANKEELEFSIFPHGKKKIRIEIKKNGKTRSFLGDHSNFPEADFRATEATNIKWLTNFLCKAASLPVPQQQIYSNIDVAHQFFKSVGSPLVVKPVSGANGVDVYPNITSFEALKSIVEKLLPKWRSQGGLVIEEYIMGNNYRIIILGKEIIAAYGGLPTVLVGDGKNTIAELIEQENKRRVQDREYFKTGQKPIFVNDELTRVLQENQYNLKNVLPKGKKLQLHYNLNRGTGAKIVKILPNEIHPDVKDMAIQAIQLFGLHHGAVDYLASNVSESWKKSGGRICEVQASPALDPHIMDIEMIAKRMIEYAFDIDPFIPTAKLCISAHES